MRATDQNWHLSASPRKTVSPHPGSRRRGRLLRSATGVCSADIWQRRRVLARPPERIEAPGSSVVKVKNEKAKLAWR